MLDRRTVLLGAAMLPLTALSAEAAPRKANASDILANQKLKVGKRDRVYRLVTPESAGKSPPLMIALHGLGIDSISLMPLYSGLDDLARQTGSILAYPASLENHWPLSFGDKLTTELSFFDALVQHIHKTYAIDPKRIYLLGMSNGGYFSVVIASQRAKYLAGLAVHSGSAGVLGAGFETERKFPVYIAHGDADPILNVRDGRWLNDMFTRMNHPVQYEEFKGLGHIWARDQGVNDRIWAHWLANPA